MDKQDEGVILIMECDSPGSVPMSIRTFKALPHSWTGPTPSQCPLPTGYLLGHRGTATPVPEHMGTGDVPASSEHIMGAAKMEKQANQLVACSCHLEPSTYMYRALTQESKEAAYD